MSSIPRRRSCKTGYAHSFFVHVRPGVHSRDHARIAQTRSQSRRTERVWRTSDQAVAANLELLGEPLGRGAQNSPIALRRTEFFGIKGAGLSSVFRASVQRCARKSAWRLRGRTNYRYTAIPKLINNAAKVAEKGDQRYTYVIARKLSQSNGRDG
jgi:hypothetical protein